MGGERPVELVEEIHIGAAVVRVRHHRSSVAIVAVVGTTAADDNFGADRTSVGVGGD